METPDACPGCGMPDRIVIGDNVLIDWPKDCPSPDFIVRCESCARDFLLFERPDTGQVLILDFNDSPNDQSLGEWVNSKLTELYEP